MPRPGLSPLRQRQLIDATIVALHRHGLGNATVARIGRAAGFSPALVHHYFPDKDTLLAATMRALLRELRHQLVSALARARGPRERLDAVIDANLAPAQLRPEVIAAWLSLWVAAPHSPSLARLQRIYALRLRSHLYRELRRLVPDAQAWPAALGTAALIDGLYLRCALGGTERLQPATARALARDYLDRQLEAGAARPREPGSVSPGASFDHVIVGAGSAGCVLAARLSEDPARRVLLLEAGPADRSWTIRMPAALTWNLMHQRYNWGYRTEPQAWLDERRLYWPRGRVLGGSSSLNAMVYIRGHPLDYERWRAEGAAGWGWAEVLPYFRKAESFSGGADPWRGGSGPLVVTRGTSPNPLYDAFITAGEQAGYGRTDDLNGFRQEGFGRMDMTIDRGRRCSAARAYLRPALTRPNLVVVTGALVTRIRTGRGRAQGVDYVENRVAKSVAAGEVILAGGAVNSPQLLLLSGIGPAEHLRAHGIAVAHDLPGVGANLQDHLELYVQVRCKEPHSLLPAMAGLGQVATGLEWFLLKTGPGASSHLEAGAFIRSAAGVEHPDIQYHFLPALIDDHGRAKGRFHAYQVHVGPMRPAARGTIRLRSADPREHPVIEPNYLSEPRDRAEMRACVELTREIFAQPAFDRFRDHEIRPGAAVRTRAEIDAFVRQRADSAYHPCCTCAMGPAGGLAVVDAEARVHGLQGLRVVDASIMPSMVSGNLNAPVIMMAEKLADAIRGRPPLPPEPAAFWLDPRWRARQREHPPGEHPHGPNQQERRQPCVTP